ncbi:MAG: phospholipase D-like domain-containing protein [Novosphingobium sp.]
MASRAHVVIDAAAYFSVMQEAMLQAQQRVHLIGWDFDTRVKLGPGRRWWNRPNRRLQPARLGAFVVWLVRRRPGLQVRVLKWNFGALKFVFRGSMILDLLRWWTNRSIDFKFDSAHPFGSSHHQKIVVIDDKFAVCGGIDMTTRRWDTPEHIEDDPRRMAPGRKPYDPWHDITFLTEGVAAAALGKLGRMRWERAGGTPLEPCLPQDDSPWPARLRAEFRDVEIGIARTQAEYGGSPEINEIEQLFIEHISRAKRFIYAESQYFASRKVAEALAERLSRPDPPEVVLINPKSAEGWLEQAAMDGARVRLCHAVGQKDVNNRFRIYIPYTTGGTPIYVHSKLMIVDDEILRIGSANMNNRSMGLDTEADVYIDCQRPANDRGEVREAIRKIRMRLIAEHCGMEPQQVGRLLDKHGSMIGLIEARINDAEAKKHKRLERFHLQPLTETEKAIADTALLDPERPGELFEPIGRRRGLFRLGGLLHRPK